MKTVMVLLGGGISSAVLLSEHISDGDGVIAVTPDYGFRGRLSAAIQTASRMRVKHVIVDMTALRMNIPSPNGEGLIGIVPAANTLSIAVALSRCVAYDCEFLSIATNPHTMDGKPLSEDFIMAAEQMCNLSDEKDIQLMTRYQNNSLEEIVQKGYVYDTDLSMTWSCEKDLPSGKQCGRCAGCIDRRHVFHVTETDVDDRFEGDGFADGEMVRAKWQLKNLV